MYIDIIKSHATDLFIIINYRAQYVMSGYTDGFVIQRLVVNIESATERYDGGEYRPLLKQLGFVI